MAMHAKRPKSGATRRKIEAAVDSGAVGAVVKPRNFPEAVVTPTAESQCGEEWVCA